jgi:pimeloyl-ACP methyl ester carboxylesterase
MPNQKFDTCIDLTGLTGLEGPLRAAVSVTLPSRDIDRPCVVAFAFPGAGYSRGYFDLQVPGLSGYSQAEYHAEQGWIFVSCDHLGTGASSLPDPELLSFEVLAAGDDAVVRAAVKGLRDGTLLEGVAPVKIAGVLGMGQSMGGCLAVVAQGVHRTFDAMAVLGFSSIHTVLPSPQGDVEIAPVQRDATGLAEAASAAALGEVVPFEWAFHWEDVPRSLTELDVGEGFPLRLGDLPPWGSQSIPPVAIAMLTAGVVSNEAASIMVPVFVGAGERDVVPDPHAEPRAYRASTDVTVVVVPKMAHMHNFAGTRTALWRRLHRWGDTVLSS